MREICNEAVTPPLDVHIRKLELSKWTGRLVAVICIDVPPKPVHASES